MGRGDETSFMRSISSLDKAFLIFCFSIHETLRLLAAAVSMVPAGMGKDQGKSWKTLLGRACGV